MFTGAGTPEAEWTRSEGPGMSGLRNASGERVPVDRTMMAMSLGLIVLLTLSTDWILLDPDVRFAYNSGETRIASEALISTVGLGVVLLSLARFISRGLVADAAIVGAFLILLGPNVTQGLLLPIARAEFLSWAEVSIYVWVISRFAAFLLVAISTLSMQRRTVAPYLRTRLVVSVVLITALFTVGAHGVPYLLRDHLPQLLTDSGRWMLYQGESSTGAFFHVTGLHVALQMALAGLSLATCLALLLSSSERQDGFHRFLGLAFVFATFSQFHYAAYPSIYSGTVGTGDALRLAFYVTLLAALVIEYARSQESAGHLLVLQERTRIARDVHDGAAQSLSFVRSSINTALRSHASVTEEELRQWSDCLTEAHENLRDAVVVLTRETAQEDLLGKVSALCNGFAERYDLEVVFAFSGDPDISLPREQDRNLLLLLTEALHNVRKHAAGRKAVVSLAHEDCRLVLRIVNELGGAGDERAAVEEGSTHIGIRAMASRATSLGGSLSLSSVQGSAMAVEVTVPL